MEREVGDDTQQAGGGQQEQRRSLGKSDTVCLGNLQRSLGTDRYRYTIFYMYYIIHIPIYFCLPTIVSYISQFQGLSFTVRFDL